MEKIKPESFAKAEILLCDWTDKKKYLIYYRVLKFSVRHGMVVERTHEIISFKQCKWLEKQINFNTQKIIKAKNDLEKDFYKLPNNAFSGKTMENLRNSFRLEFF